MFYCKTIVPGYTHSALSLRSAVKMATQISVGDPVEYMYVPQCQCYMHCTL